MGSYVLRRILQLVPVLFGATFLIFAMVFALPGDPVRALAGNRGAQSPSVRVAIEEEYNLNDPLLVQYGKYIAGLAQGDFGTNLRGREVSDIIKQRVPITARLAGVAFVFEVLIGISAGIVAGVRQRGFLDSLVLVTTLTVISIPIFVLGFLAQITFGLRLGIFPVAGIQQGWTSYILPGLVLGSVSLALVARLTRSSLVDNLSADYVRTATSKGLSRRRVVGVHAMRNSLIPVVTYLGVNVGDLLGGAIITEGVFNIPGVGGAIFDGIARQEGATVVGLATFIILVYVFMNLLVDVLYASLDPRIRLD